MTVKYLLGIDTGGTFTDFTLVDETGRVTLWKEDSRPSAPDQAVKVGLESLAAEVDLELEELLARSRLLVHGTTIATNTLIQRSGPPIGLLCTDGFRDVLYFRDGFKPQRFNVHLVHPEPLVPRWLRIGVPERMNHAGSCLRDLDEAAVRAAAARFRTAGVKAVAIAFIWAVANGEHELRAREILEEELPGVRILCSHEVLPEIREWERTSATALSAYILPGVDEYLRSVEHFLTGSGLPLAPLIMQINGGCASVKDVLARPVTLLASGPAAAPAAALHFAAHLSETDLIAIDMGGTSLDLCMIRHGHPIVSRHLRVEDEPVGVSGVEVTSIGAGGGSIAWVDSGGALQVGPQSAGAVPGPACYAQGGERPTVTDANVVLGYLAPEAFLGGRRVLDADAARAAVVEHVGTPLGLDVVAAASGIIRIVDTNMVGAIRDLSTERGIDPRGFLLVAAGGAGGLHAARLARALGMPRVLIPREAGTFCSFGMTVTDVRHDHMRAFQQLTNAMDLDKVRSVISTLETAATEQLKRQGFGDSEITLRGFADARYPGQVHDITIELPRGVGSDLPARIEQTFNEEHERLYSYRRADLPVEVLHWRVQGSGRVSTSWSHDATPRQSDVNRAASVGRRAAWFDQDGWVETPVYRVADLETSSSICGPAILQASTTTILVGPQDTLEVTAYGDFLILTGGTSAVGGR